MYHTKKPLATVIFSTKNILPLLTNGATFMSMTKCMGVLGWLFGHNFKAYLILIKNDYVVVCERCGIEAEKEKEKE